jgi:hypothetical protein
MSKLKIVLRIVRLYRCTFIGKYYIPFLNKIMDCFVFLGIIHYGFHNHIVDKIKENTQRIIEIAIEGGNHDLADIADDQNKTADDLYI